MSTVPFTQDPATGISGLPPAPLVTALALTAFDAQKAPPIVESIEAAFVAQVGHLFAVMCSSAAVESVEHAAQRFEDGLKVAVACRNEALAAAFKTGV